MCEILREYEKTADVETEMLTQSTQATTNYSESSVTVVYGKTKMLVPASYLKTPHPDDYYGLQLFKDH